MRRSSRSPIDWESLDWSELPIMLLIVLVSCFLGYYIGKFIVRTVFKSMIFGPYPGELKKWVEVKAEVYAIYGIPEDYYKPFRLHIWGRDCLVTFLRFEHPETGQLISTTAKSSSQFQVFEGDVLKIKFNPKRNSEAIILDKA